MVHMTQLYTVFGQTYGEGSYSSCTYNTCGTTSSSGGTGTTGSDTGSGSGGALANTGFDIALFVTLACVFIFAALAIRIWRKSSRRTAVEPVIVDNGEPTYPDHQDKPL